MSEELEVKVGMCQGSVLSHFLFAVVLDVVTDFASEGNLASSCAFCTFLTLNSILFFRPSQPRSLLFHA